jgi:hypothetical protein
VNEEVCHLDIVDSKNQIGIYVGKKLWKKELQMVT